jgi:hypothetical protein
LEKKAYREVRACGRAGFAGWFSEGANFGKLGILPYKSTTTKKTQTLKVEAIDITFSGRKLHKSKEGIKDLGSIRN